MGKAAGVWKKIKRVAKTIGNKFGKALAWANENILKPGKKYVTPLLDMVDQTGYGKKIYDGVSKTIDKVSDHYGYKADGSWAGVTDAVGDIVMDTQRAPNEKKYKDPFQTATKINNVIRDSVDAYKTNKDLKQSVNKTNDWGNVEVADDEW